MKDQERRLVQWFPISCHCCFFSLCLGCYLKPLKWRDTVCDDWFVLGQIGMAVCTVIWKDCPSRCPRQQIPLLWSAFLRKLERNKAMQTCYKAYGGYQLFYIISSGKAHHSLQQKSVSTSSKSFQNTGRGPLGGRYYPIFLNGGTIWSDKKFFRPKRQPANF